MAPPLPLIPHRPPWLLLDRVVDASGERVVAEKRLTANDPLLASGLPETLVVEALAQACACARATESGPHRGMLVQVRGFRFEGRPQAGETLTLIVSRIASLGALSRFSGEARVGERVVAAGELTFAIAP